MRLLLSGKATCNSHGQDSSYFLGWQEYEKNPCGQTRNPQCIIQMGLAENLPQLSFDLLESWLSENQDIAGFKRNGESVFRELALFQDYHGLFGSCPPKWTMWRRGFFELRHPKMKVVVEVLTGVLFSADVTGDGTVADLKQETRTQQKLPRDHLILLLRDCNQSDPIKDDEDGACPVDVGIKDGSHTYLFFMYEESWP